MREAAFSAATTDSGRLLGRSEDWDWGRLCHDKGLRVGAAIDGDVTPDAGFFDSASKGDSFSFV